MTFFFFTLFVSFVEADIAAADGDDEVFLSFRQERLTAVKSAEIVTGRGNCHTAPILIHSPQSFAAASRVWRVRPKTVGCTAESELRTNGTCVPSLHMQHTLLQARLPNICEQLTYFPREFRVSVAFRVWFRFRLFHPEPTKLSHLPTRCVDSV